MMTPLEVRAPFAGALGGMRPSSIRVIVLIPPVNDH